MIFLTAGNSKPRELASTPHSQAGVESTAFSPASADLHPQPVQESRSPGLEMSKVNSNDSPSLKKDKRGSPLALQLETPGHDNGRRLSTDSMGKEHDFLSRYVCCAYVIRNGVGWTF